MKSEGNAKTINMQAYMHRDRITWLRRQKVKRLIETIKQTKIHSANRDTNRQVLANIKTNKQTKSKKYKSTYIGNLKVQSSEKQTGKDTNTPAGIEANIHMHCI